MKTLVCGGCGHIEFNEAPEKCLVCGAAASAFKEDADIIKKPADPANLTEGDKLAIRGAKDPANEKYRRCLMLSPELSEKAETIRTNRLLENIKLTGKVPAAGGSETAVTEADVGRMSEEELDRLAESIG
jgi:hypothetical protein